MLLFSNLNKLFFLDILIQKIFFLDYKKKKICEELIEISAKNEALVSRGCARYE